MLIRGLGACVLVVALLAGCSGDEIRSGTVESTRSVDPDPDPSTETDPEPSGDWQTIPVPGTDLVVSVPPEWREVSLDEYEEQARSFLEAEPSPEAGKAMGLLLRMLDRGVFRNVLMGEFSGYTCWIQVMVEPRDKSLAAAVARTERVLEGVQVEERSRDVVRLAVGRAVRLERVFAPRPEDGVPSREIDYMFMRGGEAVTVAVTAPASDEGFEGLMAEFMSRMAVRSD